MLSTWLKLTPPSATLTGESRGPQCLVVSADYTVSRGLISGFEPSDSSCGGATGFSL